MQVLISVTMSWNAFQKEFSDNRWAPPLLLKNMMRDGRFGKKVGKGFYDYNQEQAKKEAVTK